MNALKLYENKKYIKLVIKNNNQLSSHTTMQEKHQPIEKFYSHLIKLQHKIDKHIKTIENILQNSDQSDEELQQDNLAQLQQHSQQINKQIKKIKKQIDNALYQFQISSETSSQLGVRYDILRQSRKQVYQYNIQLKNTLQNGREKLKRLKKLQNSLNSLQNSHRIEKTSVNKLQLAYNNAIKLQKQILQKVEEIDKRQQNLLFELQKQREKDIQVSQYWRNRQRYDKLVSHKNTIHKHIESRVHQGNKSYKSKYNELELMSNRINNFSQVYQQLQVTTNQQNYIIKDIMMRENLTGLQLLQEANVAYGEQFLFQDKLHKLKDNQYLKNQIKKFRKRIGTQDNSSQKYSSIGQRKRRIQTDHMPSMKEYTPKRLKINTQAQETPQTMQNQLRMTTKILLNQPKRSLNLSPIKSTQIYPGKMKKLQINNKTSQIKINSDQLSKQRMTQNREQKFQINHLQKRLSNQNQPYYLVPITHDKISSFSTPKNFDSKFTSRNSQNIRVNKIQNHKEQIGSEDEMNKKQKFQDFQLNFRIRTKQGYIYKKKKFNSFQSQHLSKQDDLSSQNSSCFRQKSQIIQLYDKLARQDQGKNKKKNKKKIPDISDCVSSDKNSESNQNDKNSSLLNESNQFQSSLGEFSSYVKLNSVKRKRYQQGNKLSMQSRQSDTQKMQKDQNLRNSYIKIDNIKKTESKVSKNQDFQSKYQQIRKRLKTIHEKQEQIPNRGNSP